MDSKQTQKIEISFGSVVMIIATVIGLWLFFYLREIVLFVFIAFIIASALGPPLRTLQRHKIPQALSIATTFLIIVGLVILIGFMILPALYE